MKDSGLYPVGVPPANAMMQAYEVLTWIAFRRAVPWEHFACLFHGEPNIWSGAPQHVLLWALQARAGSAEHGPCYSVASPWPRDDDTIPSSYSVLTRQGPRILRFIRAQYRKETARLMTFAEVAALHKERLAEDKLVQAHLGHAKRILKDKTAGGLLTAYGIPMAAANQPSPSQDVRALPATLFMHPAITFTDWNGLGSQDNLPHDELQRLKIPNFGAIQFQTKAVLEIWPASDRSPGSPAVNDPWLRTGRSWIWLSDLLSTVERELLIPAENAARPLRRAMETYAIGSDVPDLVFPTALPHGHSHKFETFMSGISLTSSYRVSWRGWEHVDWQQGTLCGYKIRVRWLDVKQVLRQKLPPSDPTSAFIGADEAYFPNPGQQDQPMPLISDRTGQQGRPTSKHLVLAEYERRLAAGDVMPKVTDMARALSAWLVVAHPGLAPMKPKTVANSIRARHRESAEKHAQK